MTETARQDSTNEPAAPAATESAATQGEAQPEPSTEPEVGDAMAETVPAADGAKPDLDETKRKFREALERKHQAHSEGQGKGGRNDGKISGAHGPAASRRSFRRKSG
ncbi:MAG: DUF5302 domain-containing protein [Trebonia sp.]